MELARSSTAVRCIVRSSSTATVPQWAAPLRPTRSRWSLAPAQPLPAATTDVDEPRRVVCHAAGSSPNSHAGYAFLHDFCMTIPYGAIATVAGLVLFFMPGPVRETGITAMVAGLAICACSVLSLKQWKQGAKSTPFTIVSAGGAAAIGYSAWTKLQANAVQGLASTAAWALVVLSGLLSLFCVYNIIAGGNPPRKGSH